MSNLYNDFINDELYELARHKYLNVDNLYCLIENKVVSFINKNKTEINFDKFKTILKVEYESTDYNYYLSIPMLSLSGSALIISLGSLIVSAFKVTESTNTLSKALAIASIILITISIILILIIPFYSKRIYKNTDKIFKRKRILGICLELLENYGKQFGNDTKLLKDDNNRYYKVIISEN